MTWWPRGGVDENSASDLGDILSLSPRRGEYDKSTPLCCSSGPEGPLLSLTETPARPQGHRSPNTPSCELIPPPSCERCSVLRKALARMSSSSQRLYSSSSSTLQFQLVPRSTFASKSALSSAPPSRSIPLYRHPRHLPFKSGINSSAISKSVPIQMRAEQARPNCSTVSKALQMKDVSISLSSSLRTLPSGRTRWEGRL